MSVSLIAGIPFLCVLVLFSVMGAIAVREDDFNYDYF